MALENAKEFPKKAMTDMTDKKVLGMPRICFFIVCAVLVIGIAVGSFGDFSISETLTNQTDIGDFFQHYGNILSHFLYPVAGVCIFKGLRKIIKKLNALAWGILGFSLFWTVYSFLDTGGKYLRKAYGYVAGESSVLPLILAFMTWIAIAVAVAFLAYFIIDDEHAELLIAIGAIILISGMFSEFVNEWLKVVGCRPRYRYLITLDDPKSEYRNWWEMRPYIADESNFRSWPSGHMTKATIMFTLPVLASVIKNRKEWFKYAGFIFAVLWIIIMGYNRIHMNAHFLSDVCFGVLITYIIYALVYTLVFSAFPKNGSKAKNR